MYSVLSAGIFTLLCLMQDVCSSNATPKTGPIVNLGYSSYEGVRNETSGLNVFKGYVQIVADAVLHAPVDAMLALDLRHLQQSQTAGNFLNHLWKIPPPSSRLSTGLHSALKPRRHHYQSILVRACRMTRRCRPNVCILSCFSPKCLETKIAFSSTYGPHTAKRTFPSSFLFVCTSGVFCNCPY